MYVTNAFGTAVEEVTHFLYDLQGNRTFVFYPDGTSVTNWYDSLRRPIATADGIGTRWFGYNNQGLLTSITNAAGVEQSTVFDIEDRVYSVTHANGVTVTNTYDNLGRPRTRTYPDGGVEKFGYSARGVTAYTNQLNLVTYYTHDEAGRKTVETNANNEITKYAYNAAGDLATLTDGKTNVTTWNYDQYGRVTNKVDQASFEILRYQYSAAVGSHISAAACVTSIQQQWGSAAVGSFSSGVIQQQWGHSAAVGSFSSSGVIQQQWGHISKFDN
jgi:YD repeat-containing protein